MLTRRAQLLIITLVVVVVYHPILSAGLSAIDDFAIMSGFSGIHGLNLWEYVSPSGGLYYRPLIGLSFLADTVFHGLSPFWMHLENILLHLTNAVLVYFLVRRLITSSKINSLAPLAASLLFALHPLNTESVNWISGRTDVLATAFLLASSLFLVEYKESGRKAYLFLSLITVLVGAFAKETALAFLPGFVLIVQSGPNRDALSIDVFEEKARQDRNKFFVLILGSMIVFFIAFMTRSGDFIARQSRMAMTLRIIMSDWMHTMFVVLRAFGFYIKKLFLPLPLNFAIMEVDPFYEILAVPMVILCAYIASRKTLLAAIFTSGIFLIAPAFVLAFGQIAWTPYAERYVYSSSAFLIVAAVVFAHSRVVNHPRIAVIGAISLVLLMFTITLQRGMVWKTDITLAKDTVEKSPYSRDMRALYGSLLAKNGDYAEAMRQLEAGKKIPGLEYDDRFDVTIASIYQTRGENERAITVYKSAWAQSRDKSANVLTHLIDALEQEKKTTGEDRKKQQLNRELFPYTLKLFKLNHDPHVLIKLGDLCSELGQRDKAVKYFMQAHRLMSDEDPARKAAALKINELSVTTKKVHEKNAL
jgi:protein O-mannosyl-transferase